MVKKTNTQIFSEKTKKQSRMKLYNELSINDMIELYGGAPSTETSLAYDIVWYVTTGVKWVVDLF